jgi:PEP-CTERM motif
MNNTIVPSSFSRLLIAIVVVSALLAQWAPSASAGQITSGQLVNIRVGDGTTTAAGTALPVQLDVYNVTYIGGAPTSVTLAQTIAVQSTETTSGNRALQQGGTAGGEGGLTLSTNGQYMALAGYNVDKGEATNGSGNNLNRVVGLLKLSDGSVDTTTDYTDTSSGNAIRNAFTTNGTDIWTANSANGVRYVALGASTSTALTGTGNERRVYVNPTTGGNVQLYTSRMSGTIDGVATVGAAGVTPPTSGTQTVTLLPGFPTATNSMYDYFFADANTIYTVDDRNAAGAGLEKWVLSGGTWSMVYSKLAGGTTGLKSLTGFTDANGNVVLFGATVGAQTNKLYGYGDTLANTSAASVSETLLVDAATPSTFGATGTLWSLRGVALSPGTVIPEPATFSLLALGCLACLSVRSRKS